MSESMLLLPPQVFTEWKGTTLHLFYMFYMNILYVIGCKNIHTVLLKLYNQFYMNILYEIVCKNVHTFMKKNIWILLANFH